MEPAPPKRRPYWLDFLKALRAHHPRWDALMQLDRLPHSSDIADVVQTHPQCEALSVLAHFKIAVRVNDKRLHFLRDPHNASKKKGRSWALSEGKTLGDLVAAMLENGRQPGMDYSVDGHVCSAACPSPADTDQYSVEEGSSGLADIHAAMATPDPLDQLVRDAEKARRRSLAAQEIAACDAAIVSAKRRRDEIELQLERDIRAVDDLQLRGPLSKLRKALDGARGEDFAF